MSDTIKLGARELPIAELTLGQMRLIGIGTAKARRQTTDPSEGEKNFYDSTFEIVSLATGVPVKELEAIKGVKLGELLAARRKVIVASGLMTQQEVDDVEGKTKVGEAPANVTG